VHEEEAPHRLVYRREMFDQLLHIFSYLCLYFNSIVLCYYCMYVAVLVFEQRVFEPHSSTCLLT